MDMDTSRTLTKVLGKRDIDKIPPDVLKKLEKYFETNNEQLVQTKVLYNTTQKNIEKHRKEYEKLLSTIHDTTAKRDAAQSNVTELRHQLDTANAEVARLTRQVASQETETVAYRKENSQLIDEKDQLMKVADGKDATINHLQSDLKALRAELKSALSEKNDAITRFAEMAAREQSMDDREKRLQKENERLSNEVVKWTEKYTKIVAELTVVNQDKASAVDQLEKDLRQKTEELSAANFTILQLTESTQLSSSQRDGESTQLKNQFNESAAMIEHYKRELDAKIKLVDLYKANVDESEAQTAELRTEVTNLNRIVKETTEKSAMLASNIKDLQDQHQAQLTEMSATIEKLNGELRAADDRLKSAETERVENVLEKLFPRAATSNRMLKDNATLTEIFSRYNDSVSDVHRLEVECLHLNTQLECLTIKLQDTTAEFERQQVEYKKILKQKEEMTEQVDAVVAEQENLHEKLKENSQRLANAESENVQLKYTQKDLARQICNLLNKVETGDGNEPTSDQLQFKRLGLSNEAIRKELITFDNIVELQENNQKLMLKIRELSSKVQKLEEQNVKLQSCEQKISYLERQVSDGETARLANEDLLAMITKQKERFKQLYFDAMNYMGKQTPTEEEVVDNASLSGPQSSANHSTTDRKDKRFLDVELKLQEKLKELKTLKEEHNEYRKQATINFDMLKQQCESAERRVSELISENSKLRSQDNFVNEQMKSLRNDIVIYKKQIQVLEERNQIYDKTIATQEVANKQLKDEAWNTIMQLSKVENRCSYLELECKRLIEAKKNLEIENGALHRQKMTQSILESTCELAKISSERSDFEGRVQIEKQLEDQIRQCDVLKRKLDAEQIRFKEENESMKRQRENALKKLSDEQGQSENLRTKLSEARDLVEAKTQQIKNLSEKLQEALTPCKSDNPIAKGNKKIKDLELQVKAKVAEIGQLKAELQECEEKIQSFTKFKSDWEDETKALKENYEAWKTTFNAELQASRLNETNLKSQVDELQQEIRIQLTSTHSKASTALSQSKLQAEHQEALQKITVNNKELRELRTQCHKLKENLQVVERNYANEMLAHSSDLQELTLRKDQLNKYQDEMYQLKASKEEADELMKKSQLEWEETTKKLIDDRQELEHKIETLEKQNLEILDLLQAQNSKNLPLTGDTLNESIANNSILNRTLTDDEFKEFSYEKLFGVVKYLRREKDIVATQTEILRIENTRLLAELDSHMKRISELDAELTSIKSAINAPDAISPITNYEDLRRTMETLNAVTDTNIHLREEKLKLDNKIKKQLENIESLQGELAALQETNRELLEKNEEKITENNMLRSNIDKLRQKITDVSERSNKNPEDFKRLQNERENLAKMFTAEKDNLRLVNEQLNSLRTEKSRIEQDSAVRAKQLQAVSDDKKKLQDELNNFKQINVRLTVESIEIKANILKKEEELKAIQTELTSIEDQLKDSRSKEMQLRKIAKKYREAYTDLKTKSDDSSNQSGDQTAGPSTGRADTESMQELSNKLTLLQEEINELKKENENLRKQDENQIVTDARNRIAALNEANRQITRDYQVCKSQLQSCEQHRSQHESIVTTLKSQLEAKIKELLDQDAARQETIARLTRENETFNTRVNQLHRQFQQQGSKPSTSSVSIEKSQSDPARTANVKPMATPSTQSAPVNLRRGGDTPLASIRPVPVQNSRIAAVLPTSQTSNVATVQGSSSAGNVTTALVPPQQQVHTTGNTSTAEAMSSSPTSSHTDYMPATSSAAVAVAAVPPMGSASAESTQEAESLSVNTNESSSSSSSQAVMQQQTVALVSPRVEVAPQNVSIPSQQVVDQAASTSGSTSSSFITAMSSHHQASSSNTVTTSQAGHKRPRDADGDSSTGVEESSASEKNSPQNKRTRVGEQTFQGVTESGLDVEYQVPTSSQRDQEDDVVAVDSDEDEENMDAVDVDENFDGDNNDTDEIESFGQDEGEGIDIDEDAVPNDSNEVDVVDDSSNAPNQSSSGLAVSSEARGNVAEVIELSPSGQENQQIQTISSGSDAGPSSQANLWRQAQTPTRQQQQQQQQQQQSLVIQQAYEEMTDDSIVPSTPTLYVARRADGFSEAISSPHPTVPHGSRFTFGESGRAGQLINVVEGMDDTRVELNLLEGSGDGGQSSSSTLADVQPGDNVDLINIEGANNQSNEPVAGPSSQAHGSQIPVAKKKRKTDDDASTTNVGEHLVEVEVASAEGGSDGVSSEGEKAPVAERVQVEEDREAEASVLPRSTRSRRVYQRGRGMSIDNQRANQMIWHQADNNFGRYHPMPPHHQQQQHGNPHRGSPTRGGPLTRGGRGRPPRRPYR